MVRSLAFLKYLLVGVTAFALDYAVFLASFVLIGLNYLMANAMGFLTGFFASFLLNRRYTFGAAGPMGGSLVRYSLLASFSLLAGSLLMVFFVEWLSIDPAVSKVLVVALTVCWNFPLYRYVVFRRTTA